MAVDAVSARPANGLPGPDADGIVIRSRRLRLAQFQFEHAQDLLDLDADPRVRQYLIDDPVTTPTEALLLIDHLQSVYNDGRGLGIWRASNDEQEFLGHFSLMPVDENDVAIGVRMHPDAWGRHYAIEGGRALCDYAFNALGLARLVGYCDPGNRVVDLLLRRLRFKAQGVVTQDGNAVSGYVLQNPRQD